MTIRPRVEPRSAALSQLVAAVSHAQMYGADVDVTGITIDSREVQPGDLFAALRGSDFDGHRYISMAIERGAAAILVEELPEGIEHPSIVVDDTRQYLGPIAAEFYGHPSKELTVIGITGTDGKTTTSNLVQYVLSEVGIQTGVIGTLGIGIGDGSHIDLGHQTTPESHLVQGFFRQMVESGTRAVVIEATSHGLAMHRLDATDFDIAGVTNITHEHLEYHKTIEAYRAAKGILIERVAAVDGTVVLNADDEGAMSLASLIRDEHVRTYAVNSDATYLANDVVVSHNGCGFGLIYHGGSYDVQLPMLGEFNVYNALCAIALADAAGVHLPTAIDALMRAPGVAGRMQRIDEGQGFGVVVDYAHTPASLEKILTLLRGVTPHGKLIVVSGSAGERDATKRPMQGRVMADLADIVIITSEDPRNEDPMNIIQEIALGAEGSPAELHLIEDRTAAIEKAFDLANDGDTVLLAGKGHETSIIWGFEHRPWNEAEVARDLLQRRITLRG